MHERSEADIGMGALLMVLWLRFAGCLLMLVVVFRSHPLSVCEENAILYLWDPKDVICWGPRSPKCTYRGWTQTYVLSGFMFALLG